MTYAEIKSAIQATLTVGGFTFTVGGHTYKGGNGARRYQVTANGQILSSVQTPGPSVKREEEVGVRVEDMDDGNGMSTSKEVMSLLHSNFANRPELGNPLPTFTLRHAPPVSPGQIFAAMQQAVTFRDIAVEASSIFKPKPPYCGQ